MTGVTPKTIRYYEQLGLLPAARRSESGYRLYRERDVRRLEFIKKAKRLGLSLDEIRDVLALHEQKQQPCRHVLALLEQKLTQVDSLLQDLSQFRSELAALRDESKEGLGRLPEGAAVCGIIERGIHARGEVALTWIEGRRKGRGGKTERAVR